MTLGDGKPCKRCGTSEWYDNGNCKECGRRNNRKYKARNAEEVRIRKRCWQKENPEKRAAARRRRRAAHREYKKQWRKRNPEKRAAMRRRRRAAKAGSDGKHSAKEFEALCDYYDNRCLACGQYDENLTVDHVVPLSIGGSNDISNIQPLCHSCNSRKQDRTIDYRTKPTMKRWVQQELFGD